MNRLRHVSSFALLAAASFVQAQTLSAVRDFGLEPKARLAAYEAAIEALAAKGSPSFGGPDAELEAELARIGRDRRARPEVYERLVQRYRYGSLNRRSDAVPYPTTEDRAESYRLIWEYLLLRPLVPGESGSGTLSRALVALTTIANEASVPVLVEAFGKGFDPTLGSSNTMQKDVLSTLACIPSVESLDAILECAAAAERQLRKLDAMIASTTDRIDRNNLTMGRWHPQEEVVRIGGPGADARWAKILSTYRAKDADPLKAAFLAGARSASTGRR